MATPAIGIQAKSELDELYRTHAAEVYRYAFAVLGNGADAEDITQTTFVNALRALERGERPRKPANWLITIAHNLIRQRFRQLQARPHLVELDRDVPTLEADDDGPSIEDLIRALQRIPETQRAALVLREMEGRSYKEIASILEVSLTALEGLIFRARRSLAEELENLVTCDRAELALSRQADDRLGRKERKRLVAHLKECPSCMRIAALGMKRSRAFRGLALLPLPLSLTLFKGAPSASAAIGLPTIGATAAGTSAAGGTAAAVVAGGGIGAGVAAKVAIGFAAVAVAGGAGYEGVKAVSDPATPVRPAKAARAVPEVAVDRIEAKPAVVRAQTPAVTKVKPVAKKPKPHPVKPARAKTPVRGRSATAPGQLKVATTKPKAAPKPKATLKPAAKPKVGPKAVPKPKASQEVGPKVVPPGRAKSAEVKSTPAKSTPAKSLPLPVVAGPKPKQQR
jgi:RNA polymerase sigma factor (sigma-70 family)